MLIDINKVKVVPKSKSNDFELCVYGLPTLEINEWIYTHSLKTKTVGNYTNIIIPFDTKLSDLFLGAQTFSWMCGEEKYLQEL